MTRYALWAAGILVLFRLQFWIPTVWEADGYYHIRSAHILRTQGVQKNFHWAKYSHFADRFADKDFLYHLLLIPFTFFPTLWLGAKAAAALFACVMFSVFSWLLFRTCDKKLVPFFMAAFFLSDRFLSALARPRPMVLSLALLLWAIYAVLHKKNKQVFWAGLIYGYMHITALLVPMIALMVDSLRIFEEKKTSYRTTGAAALGLLVSYVLNPYFPNNLFFIKLNLFLVPYYAAKGGVLELGAEFFPLYTRDLLFSYPALFAFLTLLALLSMLYVRKPRFQTLVLFACSVPFLMGSMLSQRYLIHGYPVFLLWMGSHFSDLIGSAGSGSGALLEGLSEGWRKRTAGVLAALGLAVMGFLTYRGLLATARSEYFVNSHYERVAEWMRGHIPPGETIFHANWSDSQYFIGLNPQNDYFVTMDPIYMYAWNPDLYNLYRDVAHGRSQDPYGALKNVFKVRFGYASKLYFGALIQQARSDPRFRILAEDQLGVVFGLI